MVQCITASMCTLVVSFKALACGGSCCRNHARTKMVQCITASMCTLVVSFKALASSRRCCGDHSLSEVVQCITASMFTLVVSFEAWASSGSRIGNRVSAQVVLKNVAGAVRHAQDWLLQLSWRCEHTSGVLVHQYWHF